MTNTGNESPAPHEPEEPKNVWGLLANFAGYVRDLPKGQRLALLALLTLAALILTTIIGGDPPTEPVLLLIFLFAGLVALTIGKPGVVAGSLVLLVVTVGFVLSIYKPAAEEESKGQVTVVGNVWDASNRPVKGAQVSVDGDSGMVSTDASGFFQLAVLRRIVEEHKQKYGDSIAFHVHLERVSVPRRAYAARPPFELFLPPEVALAARPDRREMVSLASYPPALPAAPPQSPVRVRVILDSVRVLKDGTVGSSRWKFDVKANGEQELFEVDRERFSDAPGESLVPSAEEQIALVQPSRLRLLVTGNRWTLRGTRRAYGWSRSVNIPQVSPNTPYRIAAQVVATDGADHGSFVFYFTVLPIEVTRTIALPAPARTPS